VSGLEVLAILGLVLLTFAAAVFAAAETSLTRVSLARAEALAEDGRRGAGVLLRLVRDRERALSPILFVVLACHLGAASIVAALVLDRWGAGALAVAFAAELAVVYVVAEAIPKTLALKSPDRTALLVSPFVRLLTLAAPLRWIADSLAKLGGGMEGAATHEGAVTEEELLALAGHAEVSAAIDPAERELIASILTFGDTIAEDVMVPRPDMVTVDSTFRIVDVLEVFSMNGLSRMPVTGDSIDDVVGVVHAKDCMRANLSGAGTESVSMIQRPPRFVPDSKKVAELMREMQAESFHLAVVVDEHGGVAGLVTLEDLIEELVGEIVDEFDVEEPALSVVEGAEHEFVVSGRLTLAELESVTGIALPEGEWHTVGGLVFTFFGHVPEVGAAIEAEGHRLVVERVVGRRISRVRVTAAEPAFEADIDEEVSAP
jgi:CBS domain containing-hemolysin-like protein